MRLLGTLKYAVTQRLWKIDRRCCRTKTSMERRLCGCKVGTGRRREKVGCTLPNQVRRRIHAKAIQWPVSWACQKQLALGVRRGRAHSWIVKRDMRRDYCTALCRCLLQIPKQSPMFPCLLVYTAQRRRAICIRLFARSLRARHLDFLISQFSTPAQM